MGGRLRARILAGRSLTWLISFVLLSGVVASPTAAEEASWTVGVDVTDSSCLTSDTPASWSPHELPAYEMGNDVDLTNNPGWLPFSVNLGFQPGYDNCLSSSLNPGGTVQSSFSTADSELAIKSLQCSDDSPCDAGTLYSESSFLIGELDVSAITSVGTKSGTLTVVWTPED